MLIEAYIEALLVDKELGNFRMLDSFQTIRPLPAVRLAIQLGQKQAEIVQSDTFVIALVMGASESIKRHHQHQHKFLIGG